MSTAHGSSENLVDVKLSILHLKPRDGFIFCTNIVNYIGTKIVVQDVLMKPKC